LHESRYSRISKKLKAEALQSWNDNSSLIIAYLALVGAIMWTYVGEQLLPGLVQFGELDRTNFWGIFTSIFIHGSPSHLEGNAETLVWMLIIFVMLTEVNPDLFLKGSRSFLFWAPMISAIVANLVFYLLAPRATSFGASGVVYAALGVAIALALAGLVPELSAVVKCQSLTSGQKTQLEFNLLLSVPFIALVWISPSGFLGVDMGVNAFVHDLGFMGGLFSGYVYFTIQRHRSQGALERLRV
jgi:membrane associated rhomboid family serine protease